MTTSFNALPTHVQDKLTSYMHVRGIRGAKATPERVADLVEAYHDGRYGWSTCVRCDGTVHSLRATTREKSGPSEQHCGTCSL